MKFKKIMIILAGLLMLSSTIAFITSEEVTKLGVFMLFFSLGLFTKFSEGSNLLF